MVATWQDYGLFVEIARFRENCTTREKLEKGEHIELDGEKEKGLVPYGRGEKDVEGVYGKILTETDQLSRGKIGLVFLKSDNIGIEDIEFEHAATYL